MKAALSEDVAEVYVFKDGEGDSDYFWATEDVAVAVTEDAEVVEVACLKVGEAT